MNNIVFVGLGSNKNDRLVYIKNALKLLSEKENTIVEKVSSVYETKPFGVKEQDNFYNAAAKIKTELSLKEFFIFCKEIEKEVGRKENIRWGAREIDIDVLFYNNEIYSDENITVPHKEILLRDFVIVPLIEIESDLIHPLKRQKLSQIDFESIEQNIIRRLNFDLY